jgi:hypothetical protein
MDPGNESYYRILVSLRGLKGVNRLVKIQLKSWSGQRAALPHLEGGTATPAQRESDNSLNLSLLNIEQLNL